MSTQIKVFIPLLSTLCTYLHTISYVGELRRAIWNEESASLTDHGGQLLRQISLCSLVYPVPLEPENTLRKRVVDSARGERWTHIKDGEKVPLAWCDPQNVHVYVYVDLDAGMRELPRDCTIDCGEKISQSYLRRYPTVDIPGNTCRKNILTPCN
ncbi:hypothetical protein EDB87DRAFT_474702 [Lactarius vividus]|nr:hypothetical protein EDB87DRAFT_474702 [Lactarius vividus]